MSTETGVSDSKRPSRSGAAGSPARPSTATTGRRCHGRRPRPGDLVLMGDVGTARRTWRSAPVPAGLRQAPGGPFLHRVVAGDAPSPRPRRGKARRGTARSAARPCSSSTNSASCRSMPTGRPRVPRSSPTPTSASVVITTNLELLRLGIGPGTTRCGAVIDRIVRGGRGGGPGADRLARLGRRPAGRPGGAREDGGGQARGGAGGVGRPKSARPGLFGSMEKWRAGELAREQCPLAGSGT